MAQPRLPCISGLRFFLMALGILVVVGTFPLLFSSVSLAVEPARGWTQTPGPPSPGPPVREEMSGDEAALVVGSDPEGSQVYLNHEYRGVTPLKLVELPPGEYQVRIVMDERYLPYVQTVLLAAGKEGQIYAELEKTARAHFEDGMRALKMGDESQAVNSFEKAAVGRPKKVVAALFQLGLLYQKRGLYEAALNRFREFLFYEPGSVSAHLHLGETYEALGSMERAVTSFKLAVLQIPSFKDILAVRPPVTWENIRRLEAQVEADPGYPYYRIRLGYLYEQKGKLKEAAWQFKAVVRRYMGTTEVERTRSTEE